MSGFGIWASGASALALTFVLTLLLFAAGSTSAVEMAQDHVIAAQFTSVPHHTSAC